MKKIEVQGSLVIEHNGFLYKVTSDVNFWDPEHIYAPGEFVLFKDKLLQAKIRTPGAWLQNFEAVKPTDRITKTATNDDLQPIYESLDEIRKKLGLDCNQDPVDPGFTYPGSDPDCPCRPVEPDCPVDPGFNYPSELKEIAQRLDTIEQTYVRTINYEAAVGGNINIDYDGSVEPPESTILRWDDDILKLKPTQKIQYIVDDTDFDVIHLDDSLIIGSDSLHTDIKSVDGLTVNGVDVVTSETVVDLENDQEIHGRKHFDHIYTTESPQEDHQVPNSSWVVSKIDEKIEDAVKPRLNEATVFYIDNRSIKDEELGTKECPFKSLKSAVSYIKTIDLNFKPVTIEFLARYVDDSEMLELPNFGSHMRIVSKTDLDVELPPLYVTGFWDLDGVTLTDNRLAQVPLEIDRGYCILRNVKVVLKTPALATDAIFVHNSGVLQLASGCTLTISNNSNVNVQNAIHINAGTFYGNEDVHSNVGDINQITIDDSNSGFGVGLMVNHGARCLYLENTEYTYKCIPYVAKQASVIQGLKHNNEGECDASSMVVS